jgi:hypothetical protein
MDASWCLDLYTTLHLPPSAFIRSACLEPCVPHKESTLSSLLSYSHVFSILILCAHGGLEEQASEITLASVSPARVCRVIRFLGASNVTAHCRAHRWLHLLPGGHSRDYTANIVLHRLWSLAPNNALRRLVRMEPLVPWVWVPPLGIFLILLFLYS